MAAAGIASSAKEPRVPAGWPGHLCPNFSDWEPGDIVLVHRDHTAAGRLVTAAQTLSLNPMMVRGARCSHAAVYVGGGMVVDATWGNPVGARSVWGYCHHRSLQLRRLCHPAITQAQRHAVAAEARSFISDPYSAWEAVVSKLVPGRVPRRRALYCSTLVAFAVAGGVGGLDLASKSACGRSTPRCWRRTHGWTTCFWSGRQL